VKEESKEVSVAALSQIVALNGKGQMNVAIVPILFCF